MRSGSILLPIHNLFFQAFEKLKSALSTATRLGYKENEVAHPFRMISLKEHTMKKMVFNGSWYSQLGHLLFIKSSSIKLT